MEFIVFSWRYSRNRNKGGELAVGCLLGNIMRTQFPTFEQLALGVGAAGDLQALGLTNYPQDRRSPLYVAV
jgi:hypothetical protein